MKNEQYLRDIYYNPESSVSYSNINQLWNKIKEDHKKNIKYKELKQFLLEQPTYTIHKKLDKKYTTRKVMVSYVDQQWQADLIDMKSLEQYNKGYFWIINVIDILSRYAWSIAIKRKTGVEVTNAFKIIFKEAIPEKIQFDEGTEFYNKDLKKLLSENDIEYFSTHSEKKASVVERFNRTLKTRMWKYFTANETYKYIDILDDLVKGYNNSKHSSIGMKPINARKEINEEIVWNNLYGAFVTHDFGEPKFKVGQNVRISKYRKTFAKGYTPNFTEELFKIKKVILTKPFVYKLVDLKDEEILGYFYEEELSLVVNPKDIEYKIEKVLKTKTVKGNKYSLVKYKGYSDKFNEWVLSNKIKNING